MYGSDKSWHCNNTAPPKNAVYFVLIPQGVLLCLNCYRQTFGIVHLANPDALLAHSIHLG
jgi:hypothetical protein